MFLKSENIDCGNSFFPKLPTEFFDISEVKLYVDKRYLVSQIDVNFYPYKIKRTLSSNTILVTIHFLCYFY